MKNESMVKFSLTLGLGLSLLISSCERQGTSTGNPLVEIRFSSFSSLAQKAVPDNDASTPAADGSDSFISPLSVSQLIFCFKRLRFKTDGESTDSDPANDSDNIDLSVGEVTITPTGTSLGYVNVPAGAYTRVEFDLEGHCASGLSAQVHNSQTGSPFTTNQRITIKFEGLVTISGSTKQFDLALGSIITAADSITANNQVRTTLEGVSGSF